MVHITKINLIGVRDDKKCRFCKSKHDCTKWCQYHDFRPVAEIYPMIRKGSITKWNYSWQFAKDITLLRQGFACFKCNAVIGQAPHDHEVHHIRHRKYNGSDHPRNLIALCIDCHKATFSSCIEKIQKEEMLTKKQNSYWKQLGAI